METCSVHSPGQAELIEEPKGSCVGSLELTPKDSNRLVLRLALGYWLVFSAFNATSGYLTSVLPGTLGNQSLFVSSISYSLTTPLLPFANFNEVTLMANGCLLHALFMCSLLLSSSFPYYHAIIFAMSILNGAGGTMAWLGHGLYITGISPPDKHKVSVGLFWGIYYTSGIAGNFLSSFLFVRCGFGGMLLFFCLMSMAGVGILYCLPKLSKERASSVHRDHHNSSAGRKSTLRSCNFFRKAMLDIHTCTQDKDVCTRENAALITIRVEKQTGKTTAIGADCISEEMRLQQLLKSPEECSPLLQQVVASDGDQTKQRQRIVGEFMALAPMMLCQGLCQSFWAASFPHLLKPEVIGPAMFFASCGQVLGSFGLNWIAQMLKWLSPTLLAGIAAFCFGDILTISKLLSPFPPPPSSGLHWPFIIFQNLRVRVAIIAGFLFGLSSGVFTSHNYAILGQRFSSDNSFVWAGYNLVNNSGAAIGYGLGMLTPLTGQNSSLFQVELHFVLLFVGLFGFIIIDIISHNGKKETVLAV